jgi:hypothetical protein
MLINVKDKGLIALPTATLTKSGRKKEAEADEDLKAGRYKEFDNVDSLLKELNSKD